MTNESLNKQKYIEYIDFVTKDSTDSKSSHNHKESRRITLASVPSADVGVVIHCSDSPQGRGDTAIDIDRWHRERGWLMIGYNYVILEDGTIQTGRPRNILGSHAKGHNEKIGIVLIGEDSFTDEQFLSLEALLLQLNPTQILGHYQVSNKTCPNFNVTEFVDGIKAKRLKESIDETEIFKEYLDKTKDLNASKAKEVENLKRWKEAHDPNQVQGKVQQKRESLVDKALAVWSILWR